MKIVVAGFGQHGKDTVCEILHDRYGLKFQSSSMFAAEPVVKPYLEKLGIEYNSIEEMHNDRVSHRKEWFDAIVGYNTPDITRLGRELFKQYDIYCGIRNRDEFIALREKGLVDVTFWVDASKRLEPEPASSCTLKPEDADYVVDNNGTLDDLILNVIRVYELALKEKI